jgi:hypothetical protein
VQITPPAPATGRPAICAVQELDKAIARPPISISSGAPSTVLLSPNLCPMAPPGATSDAVLRLSIAVHRWQHGKIGIGAEFT